MPTLDDLHAVLEQRAELCADDSSLASLRIHRQPGRRRRRVIAPALVAAAVAALIAGALSFAGRLDHRDDTAPPGSRASNGL